MMIREVKCIECDSYMPQDCCVFDRERQGFICCICGDF